MEFRSDKGLSMTNVVSLDSRRPAMCGEAICTKCKHTWHAVIAENADTETMECPSCGFYHGTFRGPYKPNIVFRCNCGSDLFYLSPDGHVCHACGTLSWSWNEALLDD